MKKTPWEYTESEKREELKTMIDLEVLAYHNILTMSKRCLFPDPADQEINNSHLRIVHEIMQEREMPHQ